MCVGGIFDVGPGQLNQREISVEMETGVGSCKCRRWVWILHARRRSWGKKEKEGGKFLQSTVCEII